MGALIYGRTILPDPSMACDHDVSIKVWMVSGYFFLQWGYNSQETFCFVSLLPEMQIGLYRCLYAAKHLCLWLNSVYRGFSDHRYEGQLWWFCRGCNKAVTEFLVWKKKNLFADPVRSGVCLIYYPKNHLNLIGNLSCHGPRLLYYMGIYEYLHHRNGMIAPLEWIGCIWR